MKTKKTILLLFAIVMCLLLLASCVSSGATKRGWAGVCRIDDTLIFAAMTGKVYSVDIATGTVKGTPITMVAAVSGGVLSCIPSCGGQQTSAIASYASPVVAGDLVYIGGVDGKVYAYQFANGQLKDQVLWTYPREGRLNYAIVGGLTIANDKLYFASADGTVYALTTAEGYLEWSYQIGEKIWSAPAIEGDTLYIGSFDKKVYAIDATNGTKKWEFETSGAISATPVVKDSHIYVGSYDRCVYALDIDGHLVWKFPASDEAANSPRNWFWAKPVIADNVLYAPCLDGKVYVLDALNGSLIDTFDAGDAISSSPVLVDNALVVAATNLAKQSSHVYAFDISDGSRRELTSFTSGVNAPLFVSNGIVYIHTTGDSFFGLNVQNGAQQKFSLTVSK
jgi:outer membrane protein assembly factor BamB